MTKEQFYPNLAYARQIMRQVARNDPAWAAPSAFAQNNVAVFVKQLGRQPVFRFPHSTEQPLKLLDRKGGDMAEWPADLQRREFPQ